MYIDAAKNQEYIGHSQFFGVVHQIDDSVDIIRFADMGNGFFFHIEISLVYHFPEYKIANDRTGDKHNDERINGKHII